MLVEQLSDISENCWASFLEESAKLAPEKLADTLAHHLERQPVAPKMGDQVGPIMLSARQLLVGQHRLPFGHAETSELQHAYGACITNGAQPRQRFTAGQNASTAK